MDKVTSDALAQIKASFEQHKATVVGQLLDRVVQVSAAPHRNYKVLA